MGGRVGAPDCGHLAFSSATLNPFCCIFHFLMKHSKCFQLVKGLNCRQASSATSVTKLCCCNRCCMASLHDGALICICGWHNELCSRTKLSGNVADWLHTVISMTESCMFLMQCCWRVRNSQASNTDFWPWPLADRDFPRFSESFDIMHCRWWDVKSLHNFTLRKIIQKLFYNLWKQGFFFLKLGPYQWIWIKYGYMRFANNCI